MTEYDIKIAYYSFLNKLMIYFGQSTQITSSGATH